MASCVQASPMAFRGSRFGAATSSSSASSTTSSSSSRTAATRRPSPFAPHHPSTTKTTTLRCNASSTAEDAMKSEAAGNAKRAAESAAAGVNGQKRAPRGGDPPPQGGKWGWTLNWDPIVFDATNEPVPDPSKEQLAATKLIIGSCPRTPADIDRLIDEAGIEAIICLQCTLCHGALEIDWDPIRARALERGVPIVRVSVRDFDRLEQAKMLPEMVRKLAAFDAQGKRTYVHCTAGINRASLTVLGFLTFVKGIELDKALRIVRDNRPQANPYVESWEIARRRLLAERQEDVYLFTQIDQGGNSQKEGGDWIKRDLESAHRGVLAAMFQRGVESDLSMMSALSEINYMSNKK